MKLNSNTPIIIIYGATGTGKTDFAEKIAQKINGSIINMDMGQLYTKLSIGTAKPEWKKSSIPHYLFDVIDQKRDFSAAEYRKKVEELIQGIVTQNKKVIIVGGTGFYLYNLIFSNKRAVENKNNIRRDTPKLVGNWSFLNEIDPKRASEIHQNDTYRIERALEIYNETGICPSEYAPTFEPVYQNIILVNLNRDKPDLQRRIEQRVDYFFDKGWVQEVDTLIQDDWSDFILKKKFIGYPSIIKMLQNKYDNVQDTKKEITQTTMRYVKKQKTFWRGLCKKIQENKNESKIITLVDFDLTFAQLDLYLNLFLKRFFPHE